MLYDIYFFFFFFRITINHKLQELGHSQKIRWGDKTYVSMLLHSLAKSSPKKLLICSQSFCILSQKFVFTWKKFKFAQKKWSKYILNIQKYIFLNTFAREYETFCEWTPKHCIFSCVSYFFYHHVPFRGSIETQASIANFILVLIVLSLV